MALILGLAIVMLGTLRFAGGIQIWQPPPKRGIQLHLVKWRENSLRETVRWRSGLSDKAGQRSFETRGSYLLFTMWKNLDFHVLKKRLVVSILSFLSRTSPYQNCLLFYLQNYKQHLKFWLKVWQLLQNKIDVSQIWGCMSDHFPTCLLVFGFMCMCAASDHLAL